MTTCLAILQGDNSNVFIASHYFLVISQKITFSIENTHKITTSLQHLTCEAGLHAVHGSGVKHAFARCQTGGESTKEEDGSGKVAGAGGP
ncbi:MAG: hypothetical protein ACXW2U_14020 [Telluria sp.]